jgi:hypothetical protein
MPRFPYHFCQALGCTEMTPEGADFCACHIPGQVEEDLFFPMIDDDFADASQLPEEQPAAPGDAQPQETATP